MSAHDTVPRCAWCNTTTSMFVACSGWIQGRNGDLYCRPEHDPDRGAFHPTACEQAHAPTPAGDLREALTGIFEHALFGTTDGGFLGDDDEIPAGEYRRLWAESALPRILTLTAAREAEAEKRGAARLLPFMNEQAQVAEALQDAMDEADNLTDRGDHEGATRALRGVVEGCVAGMTGYIHDEDEEVAP